MYTTMRPTVCAILLATAFASDFTAGPATSSEVRGANCSDRRIPFEWGNAYLDLSTADLKIPPPEEDPSNSSDDFDDFASWRSPQEFFSDPAVVGRIRREIPNIPIPPRTLLLRYDGGKLEPGELRPRAGNREHTARFQLRL